MMKIRFIEPGNRPYKPTPLNYFVYDRYIRTPSVGLNTLATIVKEKVPDTMMYSESISRLVIDDIIDADIIFIGIFTFNAIRGYKLARYFKKKSNAIIVMGGLHASMNYKEAVKYCDYVLLGEGDESILEPEKQLSDEYPLVHSQVSSCEPAVQNGAQVHSNRNCVDTLSTREPAPTMYCAQPFSYNDTLNFYLVLSQNALVVFAPLYVPIFCLLYKPPLEMWHCG
mgnify:CR=1 FL=1